MKYISFSGGADSTAMALLYHERGEDFELVFADTGAELPETYWLIPRLAGYVGKQLVVVSNGTYFQHLVNYGFLIPGFQRRWCTRVLKQKPLAQYAEGVGLDSMAIGIRADEAHRAKQAKDKYLRDYPLLDAGLDKKAVKSLCEKHGMLNPAYSWRTNVSCFCCQFQRIQDWRNLAREHPDLFALTESWEEQSIADAGARGLAPYGYIQGKWLRDLRRAEESQLYMFPEPEDEPCLICAR